MDESSDLDRAASMSSRAQSLPLIILSASIIYLLAVTFMPGGSLWQCLADIQHRATIEKALDTTDASFRAMARGGNLSMHFAGFNENDPRQGAMKSEVYFRAAYALYPREVLLGRGEQTINSIAALQAADDLPDDQWLREHGVCGVYQLDNIAGQLHVSDRPIPKY